MVWAEGCAACDSGTLSTTGGQLYVDTATDGSRQMRAVDWLECISDLQTGVVMVGWSARSERTMNWARNRFAVAI